MAPTLDVLSTTLRYLRDEHADALFKKNNFLHGMTERGGKEEVDGGSSISRPIAWERIGGTTDLSPNGYAALPITAGNHMRSANYDWARLARTVVISGKDQDENRGERAILSLLEKKAKIEMGALSEQINDQVLRGGLLGSLNTLNGFGGGPGFLEDAAPAAQVGTVGGLSKVGSPRGWKNQYGDIAGDFSTNGLAAMHDMYVATRNLSETKDSGKCFIVSSTAGFTNYKRSLEQRERYIDQKSLDGGLMTLMYHDSPLFFDGGMPDNGGADDEFSFYFIDTDALKLVYLKDRWFDTSDFKEHPDYDAFVAKIIWQGQLVADHLGSLGVLQGGDTF